VRKMKTPKAWRAGGADREFMYLGIGWSLMDLRQDIEFFSQFGDGPDWKVVVGSLIAMQQSVAEYADARLDGRNPLAAVNLQESEDF